MMSPSWMPLSDGSSSIRSVRWVFSLRLIYASRYLQMAMAVMIVPAVTKWSMQMVRIVPMAASRFFSG